MRRVTAAAFASILSAAMLSGCEFPPPDAEQVGFRGVAMEQVNNPRRVRAVLAKQTVPEPLPPASPDGPRSGAIYQNVQVLGDLSIGQFTRLMQGMTQWVSPEQGCAYCHVPGEALSADTLYTKVVARRMLQMTQNINVNWSDHVGMTGVTCYTCHRGNNVPAYGWYTDPDASMAPRSIGNRAGQNRPADTVAVASLPYDPFTPLLGADGEIRVIGKGPLPGSSTGASIQETERTYGLMMHMSTGLGVNCTYCHNSRAFSSWEQSLPQRTTAWYGIRMVRELNGDYVAPLNSILPAKRLGPTGDTQKINCETCHQGVAKPLNGAPMAKDYPELMAASGYDHGNNAAVAAVAAAEPAVAAD